MRKIPTLFLTGLLLFLLAASGAQAISAEPARPSGEENDAGETKILIAYFSSAGNIVIDEEARGNVGKGMTRTIAELIHGQVGGDMFFIETADKYPANYNDTIDVAMRELRNNTRPALASHVENMDEYDIVFLGYPIWWQTLPRAVLTFIEAYDFSGKTVIPFCTYEDSGVGRSVGELKSALPNTTFLEGFGVRSSGAGNAGDDVARWISELDLKLAVPLLGHSEDPVPTNVKSSTSEIPQEIYLWEDGNMPTTTVYTENTSGYFDPPDFRPNMVYVPAKQGVEVKGAVLICAGGAFQVRADSDGMPVAQRLSELGYQSFIVNYRLHPYTMQEGALDLARAVRYVRSNAEALSMDDKDIAVIGFSAGGILCGELLLNFDGFIDGTAIDPTYVPDELDKVSADASAVSMIYSFYGRLSVASTDVEKFRQSDLPPTYFLYGSEEVFRSQIEACADAVGQAGVPVKSKILEGMQHGFGARGDWFADFDVWLSGIFGNN